MARSMQALERADPFDRAFIETMIPHHESGIEMARRAAPAADRAEIREAAAVILDQQSREIEMMRRWYRSWYGAEVRAAAPVSAIRVESAPGEGSTFVFTRPAA